MTHCLALLEGIGGPELLVIGILALLLFGSKRLPELGRAFGRAVREFKRATSGVEENLREALRDEPVRPVIRPPANQGAARNASFIPPPAAAPAPPPASDPAALAPGDAPGAPATNLPTENSP